MTNEKIQEFEGIDKKYIAFLTEAGFTEDVKEIRVTYTTILPEELAENAEYHRDHLSLDRRYEKIKDVKRKFQLSLELPIESLFIEKENDVFISLNLTNNLVDDYQFDSEEDTAKLKELVKKHNIDL